MSGGTITWQYHDVGMNIDCRLMPMDGTKVAIYTGWEYSSLGSELVHDTQAPIMHHVNSQVDAIALLGKPTVISEVDDVASTHRYVFEVKVTKINP